MNEPVKFKQVKLPPEKWAEANKFAKQLTEEFGYTVTVPAAISYAIKYTNDNRTPS